MIRPYQKAVLRGTWLYDEPVRKPVYVIEQNYDYWAEIAKSDGTAYDEPTVVNGEGLAYYISFDPNLPLNKEVPKPIAVDGGFMSLQEAKTFAEKELDRPVVWDT